ncbi:MAG: tetratricopeptide repeat protein [Lachnospiraceae bacterium]|nr:tetratricopeptide repeat protein [Lachnospiraceae bacterium]
MDKYEFNIKIEQIKKLMKKKDFATAVKIADGIEWRKVRENQLLIMAADVYEIAGKYDAAREALLLAYEKTGLGRQLAYRLCRLSVKRGDMAEAQEFYEEFTDNSPRDAGKYILQYEMAKGKGESIENQIKILETFIEEDMDDRWAYELAKLYHKAHFSEKCVELCDTIILWFADGKYVEKALELKQLYVPLSENQKLKYEAQKSKKAGIVQVPAATSVSEDAPEKVEIKEEQVPEKEEAKPENREPEDNEILDKVHEMDIDVNSIHVKDFSENNSYDTMNIQKELAKSVSSIFDNTVEIFKPTLPKSAEAEQPEDDQIEGQMSLEEVLAMFESGEIQAKSEPAEDMTEVTVVPEEVAEPEENVEAVEAEEGVESEETVESEEVAGLEETVESEEVAESEELSEEISVDVSEEISEQEEVPDIEDEDFQELEDIEDEEDEVSALASAVAEEIIEDIDEEIDEEIEENEISDDVEDMAEDIEEDLDEEIEEAIEEALEEMDEEDIATNEEHSEDAESDQQESGPVMFDLKNEIEESEESEAIEELEEAAEEVLMEEPEEVDQSYEDDDEEDEGSEDIDDDSEEDEEEEEPVVQPVVTEDPRKKQSEIAKREIKAFIAKFTGVQGLDKQILKVMQSVLKGGAEPVKFIFVKGEVKSGKTTLAIDVIKLANKIMQRRDQKIAKIKGINLNDKSMDSLLEVLAGSDVLIERVSDVNIDVFTEFIDKLKEEGKPRVVIFEDEKSLAEGFLSKVPEGYNQFPNLIDIKVNKIKDWADIAKEYAKECGYVIDEMGTLALSAKIDQLRAITLVVHKNHVEQLIDAAIKDANKFSLKKLFGSKKDEDGYKILTEKNFAD